MCGIIAATAQRDVTKILIEGLRRLEYRGYDSAGIALIQDKGQAMRLRRVGKVQALADSLNKHNIHGNMGMAHTRWATHGEASEANAHPHNSDHIYVIHNGIIENYQLLRSILMQRGYHFSSKTDSEVIAHLIHWEQQQSGGDLLHVVQKVLPQLRGAYAVVVMDSNEPDLLITARSSSPLVIGCGDGENFIASDQLAIVSVVPRVIFLEEGDIAAITPYYIRIFDQQNNQVMRPKIQCNMQYDAGDKGLYRYHMEKEIYEQPIAIKNTLAGRLSQGIINLDELGSNANDLLRKIEHIQVVACGTSYNAGMVARYWFESLAGIACDVEIASEFRYRTPVIRANSLLITLSQSGETADTLAALRLSKTLAYLGSLAICNMANSSLVRETDLALMTRAGVEIGVASSKTFTTQLTVLLLLVAHIMRLKSQDENSVSLIVQALQTLPTRIEQILSLDKVIKTIAEDFADKQHALFLGRGDHYPIAMEGALKLKEISYIHAEAYAAGELKHGPLALIDTQMPVIVIAPNNLLLEKLKSNIEEVHTRKGQLYVFADKNSGFSDIENIKIISLPPVEEVTAPIFYTIPLQLLAYYVALIKGTDVDKPRNLAKSVTVE